MEKEFQYILYMIKKCEQPKFVCIPTYLSYVKCRLNDVGYRYTEFTGVLTIYTVK